MTAPKRVITHIQKTKTGVTSGQLKRKPSSAEVLHAVTRRRSSAKAVQLKGA